MDDRVIQFRVGVVMLATALVTVIFLVMLFGGTSGLTGGTYTLYVQFDEAPGVKVDTPVRKSGVLIGRVTGVELLEEGGVVVTTAVEEEFVLRQSETARIAAGNILGDAVVEFVPSGRPGASSEPLTNGEFIADGAVAGDPLRVLTELQDDVEVALGGVESAAGEIGLLAQNVSNLIDNNEAQMARVLVQAEASLKNFDNAVNNINSIVGDEETKQKLQESIARLPVMFDEMEAVLGETKLAMEGFKDVTQAAEENLENLKGLTEPLGERGEALADSIDSSVRNLDEVLAQLVELSRAINEKEGTIGMLVYDTELYDKINNAATSIESTALTVEDLVVKTEPILDNVNVLSDKLARNPSVIFSGLLSGRSGSGGLKPKVFNDYDFMQDSPGLSHGQSYHESHPRYQSGVPGATRR
jgi:phospholipid/cholesterol/gamma-HCH transport system substrate-binding protein